MHLSCAWGILEGSWWFIGKFEGFSPKALEDEGTARLGFGSDKIYDNGKIVGTFENLKIVPPDIVRRIEVYPPKDSEGKFVEKPWAVEKYTNDSMTDVKLSYISDISTRIDLDYKYFTIQI